MKNIEKERLENTIGVFDIEMPTVATILPIVNIESIQIRKHRSMQFFIIYLEPIKNDS